MKIITDKNTLLPALIKVSNVVERRHTLPVLANILIKVRDGYMNLVATDLEVEINTRLLVDSDNNMDFTVPAKKITDICKALDDEEKITILVEGDRTILRSGKGRYVLSSLPAGDYPNIDTKIPTQTIKLEIQQLYSLLSKTQFAMAQQDVRYYLNGLLIHVLGNKVRSVATDGHRLAVSETLTNNELEDEFQSILPRKAILELSRLLHSQVDQTRSVELQFSTSHLSIILEDGSFTSKLIDGKYPDYEKVIPTYATHDMLVDIQLLKHALHRASILSNEKYRGVRFEIQPGELTIIAHNPENEESLEQLDIIYDGPKLKIGFNIGYVLDILNVLSSDNVLFSLVDEEKSSVVTGEGDHTSKYVLMPMHL